MAGPKSLFFIINYLRFTQANEITEKQSCFSELGACHHWKALGVFNSTVSKVTATIFSRVPPHGLSRGRNCHLYSGAGHCAERTSGTLQRKRYSSGSPRPAAFTTNALKLGLLVPTLGHLVASSSWRSRKVWVFDRLDWGAGLCFLRGISAESAYDLSLVVLLNKRWKPSHGASVAAGGEEGDGEGQEGREPFSKG